MACTVYTDVVDLGHALKLTAQASFEAISKALGKVDNTEIERTDAGWNGAATYLGAEWLFTVMQNKEKRLGALHQLIFNKNETYVYCGFGELGYSRAFNTVAHEFVKSLETKDDKPAPDYLDVVTVSLSDRKWGVGTIHIATDSAGDRRMTESTSMLIPVTATTLRTQDSVRVEFSSADGTLINAVAVKSQDGEFESNVKLDPVKDGGWLVTGTYKGKKIKEKIPKDSEPTSYLAQLASARELVNLESPANQSRSFLAWEASNPGVLTPTTISALEAVGTDQWSVRESRGGVMIDEVINKSDGTMAKANMKLGSQTMTIERVWSQGKL
jgi:hypothetical protein